ncbi:MAG: hypothetical protein PHT78_02920 [Desulfitobacteriaceae bacterium]|nr:hypothetical protein [Desulfitobacteriaceae bacterium]
MKAYRLVSGTIVFISFVMFSWWFQKGTEHLYIPTASSQVIDEDYQAPFDLVYYFYHAIENNDWDKIKNMVTPEWWAEMHRSGYRQKWQNAVEKDPSLDFVMFLVANQKIDLEDGWAWVMGKVDWVSGKRRIDDENETIFFIRGKDKWMISSIRLNLPVEVVDRFYEAINDGKFQEMMSLVTPEYWELLTRGEIINSLKQDWEKNRTGVYCVFFLNDFGISPYRGWVKGDVLWNPLTDGEKETPVTLILVNENGWKIEKINGHWNQTK